MMMRKNQTISFQRWATGLLEQMQDVAKVLDNSDASNRYSESVNFFKQWIELPEQTFSGRIIDTIRERGDGFYSLSMEWSKKHAETLKQNPLTGDELAHHQQTASESIAAQAALEEKNSERTFEAFLASYYA